MRSSRADRAIFLARTCRTAEAEAQLTSTGSRVRLLLPPPCHHRDVPGEPRTFCSNPVMNGVFVAVNRRRGAGGDTGVPAVDAGADAGTGCASSGAASNTAGGCGRGAVHAPYGSHVHGRGLQRTASRTAPIAAAGQGAWLPRI